MADADEQQKAPDLLGTAEAAELLGFSPRKVHRLANTGALPIVGRLGQRGDLVFSQEALQEIAKKDSPPAG